MNEEEIDDIYKLTEILKSKRCQFSVLKTYNIEYFEYSFSSERITDPREKIIFLTKELYYDLYKVFGSTPIFEPNTVKLLSSITKSEFENVIKKQLSNELKDPEFFLMFFEDCKERLNYVREDEYQIVNKILKIFYSSLDKEERMIQISDVVNGLTFPDKEVFNEKGKNVYARIAIKQIDRKILSYLCKINPIVYKLWDDIYLSAYRAMLRDGFDDIIAKREERKSNFIDQYEKLSKSMPLEYNVEEIISYIERTGKEYFEKPIEKTVYEYFEETHFYLTKFDIDKIKYDIIDFLLKFFKPDIKRGIVLLDIVGFSMNEEFDQILMSNKLVELTHKLISHWQDHVSFIKPENIWCTGDGFYLTTFSAATAAQIATAVAFIIDQHNILDAKSKIHYKIAVHYGKLIRHYDVNNSWNYIGRAINETKRILDSIENLDDVCLISEDLLSEISNKPAVYPSDEGHLNKVTWGSFVIPKGKHFDKHNKIRRVFLLNHHTATEDAKPNKPMAKFILDLRKIL